MKSFRPGPLGVECIIPSEARKLSGSGLAVLQQLFRQLSPYQNAPLNAQEIENLADQSACLLVAVDYTRNAHMVGIARLAVQREGEVRIGVIHDLVVDREYYRRGIGTSLIHKAIELSSNFHLESVEATLKPARVAANQLFSKLGFSLTATAHPRDEGGTNLYRLMLG